MKKFYFLTLIVILMLSNKITFSQNSLKFEGVINVDSTSKEVLFERARTWFSQTFTNEKEVISISDKESGEVSGNGSFRYVHTKFYIGCVCVDGFVKFKVSIYVKDGKYRYIFSTFEHTGSMFEANTPIDFGTLTDANESPVPSRGGKNKKAWEDIKGMTNKQMDSLIQLLKETMAKPTKNQENW